MVAAIAVSAGGGGVVAVREIEQPRPVDRPAVARPTPVRAAPVATAVASPAVRRAFGVPAATSLPSAATDSPNQKPNAVRYVPTRSRLTAAAHQPAAPAAPGRQRAVARSAPGRQRAAAAKPVPIVKAHPVPAKPVHTPAAEPPASKRKATPPAAAHGKSG